MNYLDTENNFFGRQETLTVLNRRVIDLKEGYRQNIALIGNQYIGKSSVIRHFLNNLDDPDIISIYLDLEQKDFFYLFSKLTTSLLFNYSKMHELELHEDLSLLMENLKERLPHTVGVIKRIQEDFQKHKWQAAYLGLLTLPEVFTNETDKYCVFIFDEFQYLDEMGLQKPFLDLGKKIMTQKRCLYLLASSFECQAQQILSEKLSLLFGSFEILNLEPFDLNTSQQFIEQCLEGINMGATLRNFLSDFTGGHPLYLSLICKEIIHLSALHSQKEAYMPIVAQAVENSIFDKWGVLSRHFELVVNDLTNTKGNQVVSDILISLANGHHKLDQIVADVGIRKTQLTQKITRLLELGIIFKNGTFYYFKDRLLKYWLKYVYQRRLTCIDLTFDNLRREYKEEFQQSVDEFNDNARKDFASRIVELLHCFDNESLDLNGRRYKLPTFNEVSSSQIANETGGHFDVIKAKTSEANWFVVLKKDNLSENDISAILKEAKKSSRKSDRCLLISLNDLEEGVRVRALEEKFWVWNKIELNTLLTMYDKPYILK